MQNENMDLYPRPTGTFILKFAEHVCVTISMLARRATPRHPGSMSWVTANNMEKDEKIPLLAGNICDWGEKTSLQTERHTQTMGELKHCGHHKVVEWNTALTLMLILVPV